jgi:hypothetical protein
MKIIDVSKPVIKNVQPEIGKVLAYSMEFNVKVDKTYSHQKNPFLTHFSMLSQVGRDEYSSRLDLGEFAVQVVVKMDEDIVGKNPALKLFQDKAINLPNGGAAIDFRAEIQLDTYQLAGLTPTGIEQFVFRVTVKPIDKGDSQAMDSEPIVFEELLPL